MSANLSYTNIEHKRFISAVSINSLETIGGKELSLVNPCD